MLLQLTSPGDSTRYKILFSSQKFITILLATHKSKSSVTLSLFQPLLSLGVHKISILSFLPQPSFTVTDTPWQGLDTGREVSSVAIPVG